MMEPGESVEVGGHVLSGTVMENACKTCGNAAEPSPDKPLFHPNL